MIIRDLPSTEYAASTLDQHVIDFMLMGGETKIIITATHGDLPDGDCFIAELIVGGISCGLYKSGGGVVHDKSGNATGGTMATTISMPLPDGATSGSIRVANPQAITTAIRIEAI